MCPSDSLTHIYIYNVTYAIHMCVYLSTYIYVIYTVLCMSKKSKTPAEANLSGRTQKPFESSQTAQQPRGGLGLTATVVGFQGAHRA